MKRDHQITTIQEQPFDVAELFFSTTDEKGRITACNEVFLKIAAFEPEELLGAPHSIIRHPDMPRCVFYLLWEYLQSGRAIGAYVKNRASNGNYYWVFALASPIADGFISVRIKPTSPAVDLIRELYQELLHIEQGFGSDWRSGMKASAEELMKRLTSLGFDSYDDFMGLSLLEEMTSREKALDGISREGKPEIDKAIASLKITFLQLHTLLKLKSDLRSKEQFFSALGVHMTRVALNASIRAAHLGDSGKTLSVISDEVSQISKQISEDSTILKTKAQELAHTIGQLSFYVSQAMLQLEAVNFFDREQAAHSLTEEEQVARYGKKVPELSKLLVSCSEESVRRTATAIAAVKEQVHAFDDVSESLQRILLTIRFSYVTGRALTARISTGEEFSILLNDMMSLSDTAQEELYVLKKSVTRLRNQSKEWDIQAVA